ncbi:uncharacterized protein si:dkey-261j15.2 [Cololabis saira]|uniref:uncharacterized protein si:dkey-261j15.2 n=1 Tax=Cololabis saira TaxID=129043 RepID=UPI002AD1EE6A|nr:uncharacterized protein si:dkey-261j15.2 [Cololabis saira]
MDVEKKQQWSVEETTCLLAVWSSAEIQRKLERGSRTKPVFRKIQREMAGGGYERSIDQLENKLETLKEDYRDQKWDMGRSGSGRPPNNPHFDVLHAVLGHRPAYNTTGALNSRTAMRESVLQGSALQQHYTQADFTDLGESQEPITIHSTPLRSSSPSPSSSSSHRSGPHQSRPGKRKRDTDMWDYLEQADKRFLQQTTDMNTALLQEMREMREQSAAYIGLMGRMVSLMEAQQK